MLTLECCSHFKHLRKNNLKKINCAVVQKFLKNIKTCKSITKHDT